MRTGSVGNNQLPSQIGLFYYCTWGLGNNQLPSQIDYSITWGLGNNQLPSQIGLFNFILLLYSTWGLGNNQLPSQNGLFYYCTWGLGNNQLPSKNGLLTTKVPFETPSSERNRKYQPRQRPPADQSEPRFCRTIYVGLLMVLPEPNTCHNFFRRVTAWCCFTATCHSGVFSTICHTSAQFCVTLHTFQRLYMFFFTC